MTMPMFGIETEYALAVMRPDTGPEWQNRAADLLLVQAKATLPHIPSGGKGVFLANGARFYVDCGHHPEMTTPECTNPRDVVRYLLAGDLILARLAAKIGEGELGGELLLSRANVDYGTQANWGCHESYLHRLDPQVFQQHLVPHLVSRIVYTGAGGFVVGTDRLKFTLSPRVAALRHVASSETTNDRGILNTRDESLSGPGYKRLHLICGESCCSQKANFLKVGTTALVIAMIEDGWTPGDAVGLPDPLGTMQCFAGDPTCRETVGTVDGKQRTATMIQRHYLNQAERYAGKGSLPAWAGELCRVWREVLDRLDSSAPDSMVGELDWAIKLALFRNHAIRRSCAWDSGTPALGFWQELFEINTRFSQVAGKGEGIFAALDRAGVLNHRVPGVDNIERATERPPGKGRARVRGACVRRLAGNNGRYQCDWRGVWDSKEKLFLDLNDPFQTKSKWVKLDKTTADLGSVPAILPTRIQRQIQFLTSAMGEAYHMGDMKTANTLRVKLERYPAAEWLAETRRRFLRVRAWLLARRGCLGAVNDLRELFGGRTSSLADIVDYLWVLRVCGLTPRPEVEEWIQRGSELERGAAVFGAGNTHHFAEEMGFCILARGAAAAAESLLQRAVDGYRAANDIRPLCRVQASLANCKRILGKRDEAQLLLAAAEQTQRDRKLWTDLADFTLINRAKLETDVNPDLARAALVEAKALQRTNNSPCGLARTYALEARIVGGRITTARAKFNLLKLQQRLTALADSRLLAEILQQWDEWAGNPALHIRGDRFWGLSP